ncbi:YceI family protein [Echinicola strongylocentroti]|uniref:YceI family protein n=1 Tax=Echinicola strongylocentroti TaxID=1795355 RepID=A0A2Z4IKV8_9BACT|nr:YceI family protein [Echinicola strongylocentroti]AWW31741.1 YceI family protein [Echinicola strongylocentroti]
MKSIKTTGLLLASALLMVACGQKSETVETSEAQEVAAATGKTVTVDPASSAVSWTGYKPAGKHFGTIPVTKGEISIEGDAITSGSFTFDIAALEIGDMEEGSENYGKLHGHLQSPDFFDASNHPTATFEITAVEPFQADATIEDKEEFKSDFTPNSLSEQMVENPTHWISGNLTMRGNTKNIKFPAAVSLNNGVISAKAGFNIDRTDWGLTYGDESSVADKAKDKFIYNTVNVGFDIKAN